MNKFIRFFLCKHEYKLTFFNSPTKAVVHCQCAHCISNFILLLDKDWNK